MTKKLSTATLVLLLAVSSLYAGKGKIRVASDHQGAYVYVDGKKKAMTGEGFSSILLEEGEYTIKVVKSKNKYMGYLAEKKVFVGEDTSVKLSFKLKLTALNFNVISDKYFGSKIAGGQFVSVVKTKDGGFIVSGFTDRPNKSYDAWVIKFDKESNKIWEKTFGGKNSDKLNSVILVKNGEFVFAGLTQDKLNHNVGWIVKIDDDGNKIWDKTFKAKNYAELKSIVETKDGGFIAVGNTSSKSLGQDDAWILSLDKEGNKLWDKILGNKKYEGLETVIQTNDENFLVAGYLTPKGTRKQDAWFLKLDKSGKKIWSNSFGGKNSENIHSMIQLEDKSIVAVGYSNSLAYIVKLDQSGNKLWENSFKSHFQLYSIIKTEDKGFMVVGRTFSNTVGQSDISILKLDRNGNKVWDKIWGGKGSDVLHQVIPANNEVFLGVGYSTSMSEGQYNGYIMQFFESK